MLITENTFIISDTHFGHANIMQSEPMRMALVNNITDQNASSVAADAKIIENWNAVVSGNDNILHLGDAIWGGKYNIIKYLKQLNGRIHLLRGNHDAGFDIYKKLKIDVMEGVHIFLNGTYGFLVNKNKYANAIITEINGHRIMFSHFPVINNIAEDIENFSGVTEELHGIFKEYNCNINIHGHTHSQSIGIAPFCKNVSIEAIGDFRPLRIGELLSTIMHRDKK
jgi:calcineurin-like phosphoesterase family protein